MTTYTEHPGFLPGPVGPLFYVETRPAENTDRAVVLAGGGWMGSSTNRNGVLVRLARCVAAGGVRAARFDWRGTGESAGSIARFDLETPFHDDVAAVIRHLLDTGAGSVALSGICFGAWSSLVAAELEPSVDQVVLISLPFPSDKTKTDHKVDRISLDSALRVSWRLAVWRSLVSNRAMRSAAFRTLRRRVLGGSGPARTLPRVAHTAAVPDILDRLVARGVTVDLVFGEQDLEYASYRTFVAQVDLPAAINVTVIPGDLSNFGTLDAQDAAIGAVARAVLQGSVR